LLADRTPDALIFDAVKLNINALLAVKFPDALIFDAVRFDVTMVLALTVVIVPAGSPTNWPAALVCNTRFDPLIIVSTNGNCPGDIALADVCAITMFNDPLFGYGILFSPQITIRL
jgi:hypothetical protein